MTIEHATESDITDIVALLRKSLGESLMPKSEAFWKWKHIDNPFGESPVLKAVEDGKIIGLRAFMKWEWVGRKNIYRAVRAVDTATDPAFQGRGIFSKLTKALVDQCQADGTSFIFNTPNSKSMPGYLKMGWRSAGKLPLRIRPAFLVSKQTSEEEMGLSTVLASPRLDELINNKLSATDVLQTNYSRRYLQWRYQHIPNIPYLCFSDFDSSSSFLAIYRVKESKWGRELRVADFIASAQLNREEFKKRLNACLRKHDARFVSWAPGDKFPLNGLPLPIGPHCTVRELGDFKSQPALNFENWQPSLGTMEVF